MAFFTCPATHLSLPNFSNYFANENYKWNTQPKTGILPYIPSIITRNHFSIKLI